MFTRLRVISFLKQSYRSYKQNCNTISFRHKREEKKFEIHLRYVNPAFGVDKVLNFVKDENKRIDDCLDRIRKDVRKELLKKSKKIQKKSIEKPLTVSVKMIRNGELIKGLSLLELSSIAENLEVLVMEEPFHVLYNSPVISSITLPSNILASCFVYPSKIVSNYSNPRETTYVWYKGLKDEKGDINSWTEIGREPTYLVQASDVGHKLKLVCTPRNGSKTGPSRECVSTCVVEAGPGVCPFERRHLYTQTMLPDDKFRVVSYNLLADLYADSNYSRSTLFPYCPPHALEIDYRKQLFVKEIAGYNADIICLQEVDSKVFDLDLLPFLQSSNYVGAFKNKARCTEGLATFFNSNKFSLVRNYGINIAETIGTLGIFKDLWQKIQQNQALVQHISDLSQVVQVAVITSTSSNQILVIANTHLYFHPDRALVRLIQLAFSMKYVEFVYHETRKELNVDGSDISIMFCGDFNSVPQRAVFKFMTEQHVEENNIDFRSNPAETLKNVSLSQPFKFKSAYEIHPKYTNFTINFSACLDYIFYQSSNLHVIGTVPVLSDKELKSHTAIPSVVHPSDHIALVADFEWIKRQT